KFAPVASLAAALALTALITATVTPQSPSAARSAPPARDYPVQPVPFTSVHLTDVFWAPRIETNRACRSTASDSFIRTRSNRTASTSAVPGSAWPAAPATSPAFWLPCPATCTRGRATPWLARRGDGAATMVGGD